MSLREKTDLVLAFAQVLHNNGQSTDETVQASEQLGRELGLNVTVIPGWSGVQVETDEGEKRMVSVGVTNPTTVDMDRVSSAMRAVDTLGKEKASPSAAMETIKSISRRSPFPTWLFALAAGAGASALAVIFGVEHPISVVLIFLSAAAGAVLRRVLAKYSTNPFLQPLCAALLAGVIGGLAVIYDLSSSLRLIAVCPCLVLIPGPPLLNGMMDLVRARSTLGIARLVYAAIVVLAISAGLLLSFMVLNVSLPVDESGRAVSFGVDIIAAGVAVAAYSVFYSTPVRMIGWPILVGMLAHGVRWWMLSEDISSIVAAFAASLIAGMFLAPLARRFQIPFAAIGFAAVVSMIPGVYWLRMASGLLQLTNPSNATLQLLGSTISDGATSLAILLALGFGLIVPKLIVDRIMPSRL